VLNLSHTLSFLPTLSTKVPPSTPYQPQNNHPLICHRKPTQPQPHPNLHPTPKPHRHTEDRWPRKLGLRLALATPGSNDFKGASKSCPFPTAGLLSHHQSEQDRGAVDEGGGVGVGVGGTAGAAGGSGGGGGGGGGQPGREGAAAVQLSGVVGERSWGVPAALEEAVVSSAVTLGQVSLSTFDGASGCCYLHGWVCCWR